MNSYSSDQIRIFDLLEATDQTLTFEVRPMLETAWYFAGASVTDQGDTIVLNPVRCKVGKTCDVALVAEFTPGGNAPHVLSMANLGKPVSVRFGDDVTRVLYTP